MDVPLYNILVLFHSTYKTGWLWVHVGDLIPVCLPVYVIWVSYSKRLLNYLTFNYFGFERDLLPGDSEMCRRPYIWYVRFYFKYFLYNRMCDTFYWTQNCGWMIIWQFFLMFCVDKRYQDGCHRMTSLTSNLVFFTWNH